MAGGGTRGVEVQREAFPAGGGSGIVASKRYPGVLWAIRDRGGQDRPGRPQNALYAYKVTDGQVAKLAGGAAFKAVPMPVPARDWEDIGRDSQGNLWIADIGNNECDRDRHRPAQGPRARPGGQRPGQAAGHLPLPVPRPAVRAAPAATPRRCSWSTTSPT